jgi:hypothetical protein
MKKALLILSAVIMTTIVISCGGMASGDFSVKYTDEAGKDVSYGYIYEYFWWKSSKSCSV